MDSVLKDLAARGADLTGASRLGMAIQRRLYPQGQVRALHYHDTPGEQAANLERQLGFFRRHFAPAGPAELDRVLRGEGSSEKPGLLLTFDDGMLSHYEVAAPLLERYGFAGWFFVVAGIADAVSGTADPAPGPAYPQIARGERFMTWEQMRDLLARGHAVGCHGMNHVRLSSDLAPDALRVEIVDAKRRMEERLGAPVDAFCWVGGEEESYSLRGARLIREAGFRLAFTGNSLPIAPATNPMALHRTHVEADWPPARIRLALSGLVDLAYRGKRRRVERRTQTDRDAG